MRWPVVALLTLASVASAAPRAYPLAWDTATLARGDGEAILQITPHVARADRYTRFDNRLALMLGIADHVEMLVGFDVNLEFIGVPGIEDKNVDALLTNLWHVTFLKASDVIGISAYGRGSIGLTTAQLEARVIIEKQVGNAMFTVNSAISRDFFWAGRSGIDFRFEQVVSARYAMENVTAGLEFQARTALKNKEYQGTGLYLGPTVTWQLPRFWVAAGFYAQIGADRAEADKKSGTELDFRDNERFVMRAMFGFKP